MTHGGLVFIALGPPRTRYVAMLDDLPVPGHWREFKDWWESPVFIDNQKRTLSRRALVLTAANQDGGAHVEPGLDEVYAALSKMNSLAWEVNDGTGVHAMEGPERAGIRQITHEVLKTLVPGYTKKHNHRAGILVGGASLIVGNAPPPNVTKPRKIGRNSPCPCGSGKKYKRCHGALSR